MRATCKCSVCEATFTRKNNANRHLRDIHLGQGVVVALDGQHLGSRVSNWNTKPTIDLGGVSRIYWEERLRELARKALAEDWELLGDKIVTIKLEILLSDAIENYVASASPHSISDLVRKFLWLDIDDHIPQPIKQVFAEANHKKGLESINLRDFIRQCQMEDSLKNYARNLIEAG